jgi:3-deoxy-D-manno-octulosonate 8-phosphate phosphatase (KDO 8-P phosphatase)
MDSILTSFKQIKHFIFDIDGVLTDGTLLIHSDGSLLRTMNIKDGYALQLAIKKGYSISIISGAKGDAIANRLQGLGIHDINLGIENKQACMELMVSSKSISLANTLFMGDDMPDIEPMRNVFLPCCPQDAVPEVHQISKYISPFYGGKGCVRDVIEKVLKLNGDWQ